MIRVVGRSAPLRCARCLDDLGEGPWSCPSCATALHTDCHLEALACPTLGCTAPGAALVVRVTPRPGWLARAFDGLLLLGPPTGVWALLAFVAPAFGRVFREVGVCPPDATILVLDAGLLARTPLGPPALIVLLALLLRAARTRAWLPGAVFLAGLAVAGCLGVALLLPTFELSQKL